MEVENENGQKMFLCEIETKFTMIVMAADKEAAEMIVDEWAIEEFNNLPLNEQFSIAYIKQVKDVKSVPKEWRNSIPYYEESSEEKTVERIIEDWKNRK